jgi:hypothetical protein
LRFPWAIAATQRLVSQAEERETLRRNARAEAERWSWSAATQQLAQYYQGVLMQAKTAVPSAQTYCSKGNTNQ